MTVPAQGPEPDPAAERVSEQVLLVHALLTRLHATVAVAESLTGGELSAALTAPAGASAVFRGAVVVYATDLKSVLTGVDPELLADIGPVAPTVASQLARGAQQRLGATYGIGITGVAGPDGQAGRPVGEVHLALATPQGQVINKSLNLLPDRPAVPDARAEVRRRAVHAAVDLLLTTLDEAAGESNRSLSP